MWQFSEHSNIFKILLQIELWISLSQLKLTIGENTRCSEMLPKHTLCQCSFDMEEYSIKCPTTSANSKIIVRINPISYPPKVTINCSDTDIDLYNFLPAMNIGNYSRVRFEFCPLRNEPISKVFNHLGIRNVTHTEFKNADLSYNLTRYHWTALTYLDALIFTKAQHKMSDEDLANPFNLNFKSNANGTLAIFELNLNATQLPLNIFAGLKNSKALKLNLNVIKTPPNTFAGFDQLIYLELNLNVTELPPNTFAGLRKLEIMKLNLNVTELPKGIFSELEQLYELVLSSNSIELPKYIFWNQRKMIYLYLKLHNPQVRSIQKDVFEGATSVQRLDFSTKSSEILQPDVFSLLTNLSILNLHLYDQQYRKLASSLLNYNKKLTIIEISQNSGALRTLPSAFFANLPHLESVDVSNNIAKLYQDEFSELVLPSRQNDLTRSCVRISCGLSSIPADLFVNSSLIGVMVLSNNELDALPTSLFSEQYYLYHLDLSYNRLKLLPNKLLSNTTKLRVLKISYNLLTELTSELFSSLINLKELHLNNNRLKTFNSNVFSQTRNLLYVNMSHNNINFGDLKDQRDNFLNKEHFSPLHKLQTLDLRNNSLRFISMDIYDTTKKLTKLDLAYNKITSLDITKFASNVSLSNIESHLYHKVSIELNHNRINTINFTNIELFNLTRLININLNDNPFHCDCQLWPFVQYLQDEQRAGLNFVYNELICDGPVTLKAVHVRNIQSKSLICSINAENCLRECECWERSYDSALILNCSNFKLAKITTFPQVKLLALKAIQLHIENNNLLMLPTTAIPGYADVTHIYAARNNLSQIDVHNLPPDLTYLDLSHNNFKRINTNVLNFFNSNNSLHQIILSGNQWICDCEAIPFMQFVQRKHEIINDVDEIYCANFQTTKKFLELTYDDICQNEHIMPISLVVGCTVLSFGFLTALIIVLYYIYRTEIKVWMYKHRICLCLVSEEELDKDKKYDAFVSYSHKDMQFVGEHLVPELEKGTICFKLCVDVRDFIVGEYISDQIISAIDNSKRTIVVLSQNFIESVWARQEFRLAHQAALNEGRSRVIVIIYGDISNTDSLDADLKAYLKMNIYLKWGDSRFWDKLRFAMPHQIHEEAS